MTTTQTQTIMANDVMYSSWGYDQTNIDWYRVIKVTPTTVTLQEIQHRIIEFTEGMGERVVPILEPVTGVWTDEGYKADQAVAPIRRKIKTHAGEPYVSVEAYASAYLWDGHPKTATHTH